MYRKTYSLFVGLIVLSMLLAGSTLPASAAPWQTKVDPWVMQAASQGETEFLVYLTSQADLSAANSFTTKLEKGEYVYQTLLSTARRTQVGLIAELERLGVDYRSYYIANMIWVKGSMDVVQALAQRNDVAHIYANPQIKNDLPTLNSSPKAAPNGIEWNITKVNAPAVWELGYTGQGTVVAGGDTGYQWDHPALINQYRQQQPGYGRHDFNWHDAIHSGGGVCGPNSPFPCDDYGHGTHTMGTMVGDDGGSNQIGMAPGAQWIGCRNMNVGVGSPATYIECFEFFLAPYPVNGTPDDGNPALAPDVINNSWGCPADEGCNWDSLLSTVQAIVAAGIVNVQSAGNAGSGCSTVNDPAAIYDESFSVGATNSGDEIAYFSSRGPVTVDGSGRMKPDISAPGVSIRSSVPGGGYEGGWSGTSMAGPHVAGEVALLISAHPELEGQVAEIENIIEQTGLPRPASYPFCGDDQQGDVPNNTYGWGRIDALAAVTATQQLELQKTASAESILPGEDITYTLTVTHTTGIGPTTNVVLTDTVPTGTSFVSATEPYSLDGDTVSWSIPSLDLQESINRELTVQADITATGSIVNADYAVKSDEVEQVVGAPVTTPLEKLHFLELSKVASAQVVFPGDRITYTLTITNSHDLINTTNVDLTDTLPLGTSFVSASGPSSLVGDSVRWNFASLAPLSTLSAELVVQVIPGANSVVSNDDYTVQSDHAAMEFGQPVNTLVRRLFYLPLLLKSP